MDIPGGRPSAHVDRFAQSLLPPLDTWPIFDYTVVPAIDRSDYLNAAECLLDEAIAEGFGQKPAYHFADTTWTYRTLLSQANRIARVLTEDYGLVTGNRVLLRSGNNPMLVACWLAVLKAGGICVTTAPLLRRDELRFILDRVAVRFALCDSTLVEELERARDLGGTPERIGCFTPLGTGHSPAGDLDRALTFKADDFRNVPTSADDIALITFTSGSTGEPKAAAHFHRDILSICACWPRKFTVEADDVINGSPSLAFVYGLAALVIFPLKFRATVALVSEPTPENILRAVERRRVTSLYAVPTCYHQLLERLDEFDFRSVRKCASAGENLPTPLWRRWRDRTGLRIVNGIGTTEMLCHFMSETMEVERIGSTGKAVPGYTICLIDGQGQPLPRNARGRIAIRGPTGCRYLADEERQASFVQNGWNVTNDIFVQDEEGYYWFVDRDDDMIVSAGYNISPQEVEAALLEHALVNECAVVGVRNDVRGKVVRACVVLKDPALGNCETARELQEFVKSRIAPYKYPRDIRFYTELPKTHTGKLKRNLLRDESRNDF